MNVNERKNEILKRQQERHARTTELSQHFSRALKQRASGTLICALLPQSKGKKLAKSKYLYFFHPSVSVVIVIIY